jgi:hypothetical protein
MSGRSFLQHRNLEDFGQMEGFTTGGPERSRRGN